MKPDSPPTNGTRNMHHLAMDVLSPETFPDEDSPEKRDPLDDTNHCGLMNNSSEEKQPTSPLYAPDFSQAFTTEHSAGSSTVKKAMSWSSSIANVGSSTTGASGSMSSVAGSTTDPSPPLNSSSSPEATPGNVNNLQQNFLKTKNQKDREQMEEMRKQQREYVKKELQRLESERQMEKEDFDNLEKIKKAMATPASKPIDDKQNMRKRNKRKRNKRKRKRLAPRGESASASSLSNLNNESANKSLHEKILDAASIQGLKDEATRKRHETAGRIDLNAQSDILEAFEESHLRDT